MFQRDYSAVYFRPGACKTNLGVNGEGEIDRRRSAWQFYYFTLRRKAVDLFRIKVQLQRIEELPGVFYLLLPLDQPLEPHKSLILFGVGAAPPLLVFPMGGDS